MVTRTISTDYNRTATVHPACVRVVDLDFDGEAWHQYSILDRAALLELLQEERAKVERDGGPPAASLGALRRAYRRVVKPENDSHYGGPGRAFADRTRLIHRGRRYYVLAQRGGLDI